MAVVLGTALALRLFAIAYLGDVVYAQGGDAPRYLSIAQDILRGLPYGSTVGDPNRVPVYQLFLAAHLWLFGTRLGFVALSQALIDAATAVMLMWWGRELTGSRRSWVVGLLWATYPPAVLNTVVIFPQVVQVFFLTAAFFLVVAGTARRSLPVCALAAVCFSVSCLTRSAHLLFLPIFAMAPLMLWRLRAPAGWHWRAIASSLILVIGSLSVVWWTARDFTSVYRLEYLLRNSHERNFVALILRPFEPIHEKVASSLRKQFESSGSVEDEVERLLPVTSNLDPRVLDPDFRQAQFDYVASNNLRETRRAGLKLRQALLFPDGLVVLGCTGPPGGFWQAFRLQLFWDRVWLVGTVLGQPCMGLKVLMYIQHYLFLAIVIPGFLVLWRKTRGTSTFLVSFVVFSCAGIVFASNYSDTIAAVPRFAFTVMPFVTLSVGLFFVVVSDHLVPPRTMRLPEEAPEPRSKLPVQRPPASLQDSALLVIRS